MYWPGQASACRPDFTACYALAVKKLGGYQTVILGRILRSRSGWTREAVGGNAGRFPQLQRNTYYPRCSATSTGTRILPLAPAPGFQADFTGDTIHLHDAGRLVCLNFESTSLFTVPARFGLRAGADAQVEGRILCL
jgi:hypothetical protein